MGVGEGFWHSAYDAPHPMLECLSLGAGTPSNSTFLLITQAGELVLMAEVIVSCHPTERPEPSSRLLVAAWLSTCYLRSELLDVSLFSPSAF